MKTKTKNHKWAFPARFRTGAFGWRASALASKRLREAVSEIKKVARKDPVLAAEGATRLMEKLWPALQHIDSSSGALGSAVNKTLDALIPIVAEAPADDKTRKRWLDRLWLAMEEDAVQYLAPVGDHWGELCGSETMAGQWADHLITALRACWSHPEPGNYFFGDTACLSSLLAAGRGQEVLDLLALERYPFWEYRRYGVDALLALRRKTEALQYAESSRGLNQPDSAIDQACEAILISSGLHEEAYRRYGLSAGMGQTFLSRFRAIAKRYPRKDQALILADLIASTPGEEGKWFATAKTLKLFDLALQLANHSPCEPKTLIRAARDHLDTEPEFALGVALASLHWLNQGWGYEVSSLDVLQAHDQAMAAATQLHRQDQIAAWIQQTYLSNENPANPFVAQSLRRHRRGLPLVR